MDRQRLSRLFLNGMRDPAGPHRFWIARCCEVTIRPEQVVEVDEVDEYEGCAVEPEVGPTPQLCAGRHRCAPMRHLGRRLVNLKDGQVMERPGPRAPQAERGAPRHGEEPLV